jgi:hypothetical protein
LKTEVENFYTDFIGAIIGAVANIKEEHRDRDLGEDSH